MDNIEQESTPTPATPAPVQTGQKWLLLPAGIIGALVVAGMGFYLFTSMQTRELSESEIVMKGAKIFGTPIATINGEKILYADFVADRKILERVYAQNEAQYGSAGEIDFDTATLSRLLVNTLVTQVATEYDVAVTDADLEAKKMTIRESFADDAEMEAYIQEQYGWDVSTFMEKVVRPALLEEKLVEAYSAKNTSAVDPKVQAQTVLDRIKNGEDFAALAGEFGSDGTKQVGGDLGWFGRGAMVKEFEDASFSLKKGELYEGLVETQFGYHILQVTDRRVQKDATGKDVEEVKARHILFTNNSSEGFSKFMDERLIAAKITILSPELKNPFENAGALSADEEMVQ